MSPPSDIAPARAGLGRLEPHPDQIGKYRIDHVVGRGAVGIVYKAYDVHIDRAVAIKALQPEILADIASNEDTLRRFASEVRSAARRATRGKPVLAAGPREVILHWPQRFGSAGR